MRSYRNPNGDNRETIATAFLGTAQLAWLKQALKSSRATWKIVAADMPLGLVVWNDFRAKTGSEAVANGDDGPSLGRELEIADLLAFIKCEDIRNVAWITGDVHYAATHYYDPNKAAFQDFAPFYEFVARSAPAASDPMRSTAPSARRSCSRKPRPPDASTPPCRTGRAISAM